MGTNPEIGNANKSGELKPKEDKQKAMQQGLGKIAVNGVKK
jgi:hypothetical protein